MLGWGDNNYIHINMQLAYVLLWSPYFVYYNLSDKHSMQQPIWADKNTIMFCSITSPSRYELE